MSYSHSDNSDSESSGLVPKKFRICYVCDEEDQVSGPYQCSYPDVDKCGVFLCNQHIYRCLECDKVFCEDHRKHKIHNNDE